MHDWNLLNSRTQSEALLNELKGNLFEFLVANRLASHFKVEKSFFLDIPKSFKEQLQLYESHLRKNDSCLLKELPKLAEQTADFILEHEAFKLIKRVTLVGKITNAKLGQGLGESDILLETNDHRLIPLSLKLCKSKGFVNTKSGGIQSFFKKYFSSFGDMKVQALQNELNSFVDSSYREMAVKLHLNHGLSFKKDFKGEWRDKGLPELPGQLREDDQKELWAHYQRVCAEMLKIFKKLYEQDHEKLKDCLLPIVGIGVSGLYQVTCFHNGTDPKNGHQLKSLSILSHQDMQTELNTLEFDFKSKETADFTIRLKSFILQIRVKPMNVFTTPGLKVNCSIKEA